MLTQEYLKSILHYDADTGIFKWIKSNNLRIIIGSIAGSFDEKGYLVIKINKTRYRAHRLAWLYVYGVWPKDQIDHINGIKDNNRLNNLREATNGENQFNKSFNRNNKLNIKGVYRDIRGLYKVVIQINKKKIYLGRFRKLEEAKDAYDQAALKFQGEFAHLER